MQIGRPPTCLISSGGNTNRLLDHTPHTHTHTHKENVLLLPLPFFIHIGTTVRTSARAPYPCPSSLPCNKTVCTVNPTQGSVALGRLTDAVRQAAAALTFDCWLLSQPPTMCRIVSQLFWETSCVLKLQWDPSKDPTINCGYNLDPSKTS